MLKKGYDLNIQELAILDTIYCLPTIHRNIPFITDKSGSYYYGITYEMIIEELPMLRTTKDTLYRKMKLLTKKGFLSKINVGHSNGKPFYRATLKTESLYRDV